MNTDFFELKKIKYEINKKNIRVVYDNDGIMLFPEISATTTNESIYEELKNIILYHSNGFKTGVFNLEDLKGKKFVWRSSINKKGEDAGCLYVLEHEKITKGIIKIIAVSEDKIKIKWNGKANVYADKEFGSNVPFKSEFTVMLPKTKEINIDAYKSVKYKDKNYEIELLNFEDIENAAIKMHESRQWTDFNVVLQFSVICDNVTYLGSVSYTNGKINYTTTMDEKCPIKINHRGFEWYSKLHKFVFSFEVES